MKNSLALALLALVISVVALATATSRSDGHGPALPVSSVEPTREELAHEVEELKEETRRLRDRLALLESVPASEARTPLAVEFATREELESLREELRALAGDGTTAHRTADSSLPEFQDQVASALSAIREEETRSKARAQLESRYENLEVMLTKYGEWLSLTPNQVDEFRSELLIQLEREEELVRRWEAGATPEELAELKERDLEVHRAELSAILTPEQRTIFAAHAASGKK